MTDRAAVLHATWPPAATRKLGPFTLRAGAGGGKRVSAASCDGVPDSDALAAAEREMDAAGGQTLFSVRPDQGAFDRMLTDRGYLVLDPTLWLTCPIDRLTEMPPPETGFTVWPPLQVQREIWEAGKIGPARIAVMERVEAPRTSILGRVEDRPAGTAFVAVHGGTAMVHALEVLKDARRKGLAGWMMIHAARWAAEQGAAEMAVLVTEANGGAIAFYRGLGMTGERCYHYRLRP
ncbi:GNAT family N-acetyltransferase [Palleronia sp.]|uniref:GNAT family N-acetyltransferase n=1 Tax=Palleronia sp. TaxID=1940284 RepID=UPI0035C7F352